MRKPPVTASGHESKTISSSVSGAESGPGHDLSSRQIGRIEGLYVINMNL